MRMKFSLSICSQDNNPLINKRKSFRALREIAKPGLMSSKEYFNFNFILIYSDISCKECGSHFSPCIASGQSILAKEYY